MDHFIPCIHCGLSAYNQAVEMEKQDNSDISNSDAAVLCDHWQ